MPRLSLWKSEKGNDYKFFDLTIKEMFQVGATDLYIYKYLGTNNPTNTDDSTLPHYPTTEVTNIQDLLFLENRDRKYDKDIYRLRGHYNVQNLDFDLSQFGLFLTNDIIFITVHYNDMIDIIGRKLMVGDVFELPHLTDYHPLNETIPIGLRRYYQITDANFASEGFSSTWYPHLWRIKCEPLVNTQEFSDILNQPVKKDNYLGDWVDNKQYPAGYTVTYNDKIYTPKQPGPVPPGTLPTDTTYWEQVVNQSLSDLVSTYKRNIEINDAVIEEARRLVPKMGYDRSQLYVVPTFTDGEPSLPTSVIINAGTPVFPTGPIISIMGTSAVIVGSSNPMGIAGSFSLLMSTDNLESVVTDTNSGPVDGEGVILVDVLGQNVGPYGTADTNLATADQYSRKLITSASIPVMSATLSVIDLPPNVTTGLLVQSTVVSPNGTIIKVFPENTRITSFNTVNKTITVNNLSTSTIPSGVEIVLSGDFTGTVSNIMTYTVDNNPFFRWIRRNTARSFGYIAGYNSGDDLAPNGIPLEKGIAFPVNPTVGDYFLRIDYLPQKLYRWNGSVWVEISRNVRTATGFTEEDKSQLSTFINNTATVITTDGSTIPSKQGLSTALRIKPD